MHRPSAEMSRGLPRAHFLSSGLCITTVACELQTHTVELCAWALPSRVGRVEIVGAGHLTSPRVLGEGNNTDISKLFRAWFFSCCLVEVSLAQHPPQASWLLFPVSFQSSFCIPPCGLFPATSLVLEKEISPLYIFYCPREETCDQPPCWTLT